MNIEQQKIMLRDAALDHMKWWGSGQRLLHIAELLDDVHSEFCNNIGRINKLDVSKVTVVFMLYSFAIENLLKSVIVFRDKAELGKCDWSKLPSTLRSHKLYQLCKKAGLISLAIRYESLLKKLTRSAEWLGRYPSPLEAHEFETIQSSENPPYTVPVEYYGTLDLKGIKQIIKEIEQLHKRYRRLEGA